MVNVANIGILLRQSVYLHTTHNALVIRASSSLASAGNLTTSTKSKPKYFPRKCVHFHKCKDGCCLSTHTALFHTGTQNDVENTVRRRNMEKNVQENIEKLRRGEFDTMANPDDLSHFRKPTASPKDQSDITGEKEPPIGTHALPHPIWSEEELHNIEVTHKEPITYTDKIALMTVKTFRFAFDLVSGYSWRPRTESVWLTRIIFLETVAGVPGMVGAMTRHFHSLRRLRRDHGWIHTLLEEAENERMHLMTALHVREPGTIFRWSVTIAQGIFVNWFFVAYLISPSYCHRFVGYLEEEAVRTYTKCLEDIKNGHLQHWNTQDAPDIAKTYWKLAPDATMRDVILAIRADEAHHRVVNHTLGSMKPDDYNPYKPGK